MLTHKGTQTIETARLILRQAQMADAQPMFQNWASDPEVTKFLTWTTYESVDAAYPILDMWINGYKNPAFYQWMIVLKDIGEPVGSISVVEQNDNVGKAEIGYCIGRAWWHQGIVSEALTAVIDYLFSQVGMNRIEAKHDTNNPHSGGVMKKCGMKCEGMARQAFRSNHGIGDMEQYAILREDWGNNGKMPK